jgi:uncharacterized protein
MAQNIPRLVRLPKNHSFFLFGPRQVGKTTLLRQNFDEESTLLYDLLDQDTFLKLNRNNKILREEIKHRNPQIKHVIIDEVQKLPDLLDEVHYILEKIEKPPHFILTGSSARKLRRNNANMLGGRAWNFSLYPLLYQEISKWDFNKFSLLKACEHGTLPAVYLSETKDDAKRTLKSYAQVYLEQEIKSEALVRNLPSFVDFLKLAAKESGEIINYSNIASDVGVNSNTVKDYYQILVDTLLGFYLRPFISSERKTLAKSPKFYFFDTGVKRALAREIDLDLDYKQEALGKNFENFLINQIINWTKYLEKDYDFFFYRTKDKVEVDLIIIRPDSKCFAIEIKATKNLKPKHLSSLRSFAKINPNATLICASLVENRRREGNVLICPWEEIFEII